MKKAYLLIIMMLLFSVACLRLTATSSDSESSIDTSEDSGTDWVSIALGAEYRTFRVQPSEGIAFDMHVVRLDPTQVRFRVHYRPDEPLTSVRWRSELDNPLVFINANFFAENNQAIGLVVTDGIPYGASLVGYGGMFQMDTEGNVWVRSLTREPYQNESFYQVIQSFPMLIEPDGVPASTGQGFDVAARRSVIAEDRSGNILLMTTGTVGQINFYDLQYWLLNSGLDLNIAFALDGGKSTAMFIANGDDSVHIPAFSALPTILAVYGR